MKIGNADLVSGLSELFSIINLINKDEVTTNLYENIIETSRLLIDGYHWLKNDFSNHIDKDLVEIIETSELVIEEFEKVKSIQKSAIETFLSVEKDQKELISEIKLTSSDHAPDYVLLLNDVNKHIGNLISVQSQRYIDIEAIDLLMASIKDEKEKINKLLLNLLKEEKSFVSYFKTIESVNDELKSVKKVAEIIPLEESLDDVNQNIILINNEVNEIETNDPTITSKILDHVSAVFSKLNQVNARIKQTKKSFLSKEAEAQFASQFKLLTQSVSNSLNRATTIEKCDEELSLLGSLIEKLESKFSGFDEYLIEIYQKRDEINDTFETEKQKLLSESQKRISNILKVGTINLQTIAKKVTKFETIADLNTYFASDSIVLKVRQLIEDIKNIGGVTQSSTLENKLVEIKNMSMRSLRDNTDIFEDNGNIMKMGKHRFPVNKTNLDLTILNKDGKMQSHLTSTDYFNVINNDKFKELEHLWNSDLASESSSVYRSEFLSYIILNDAINGNNNLSLQTLKDSIKNNKINEIINSYTDSRYKDSYVKGVHDHDAALFLKEIVNMYLDAGSLIYSQESRALGLVYMFKMNEQELITDDLKKQYKNARNLKEKLKNSSNWNILVDSVFLQMKKVFSAVDETVLKNSADFYLNLLLDNKFEYSKEASEVKNIFDNYLSSNSIKLEKTGDIFEYYNTICLWVESVLVNKDKTTLSHYIKDASCLYLLNEINGDKILSINEKNVHLNADVQGLLGDHNTIKEGSKKLILDDYITRMKYHNEVYYPSFEAFIKLRQSVSLEEKEKLFLEDFKAKPLTSFVRNKLISEIYLPMIGDNFAKQMGTIGENRRTDLMGLLLLISPPGYGKTTLIEYVANKLGLVFVKINCPSIGHSVTSLDPSEVKDSTSRKEINKINLAFEMGNNVLLYLDDIQHTNPEFLQKFISLCDGTRKIEGVWEGKTKTYDMRGKKFSVVMAGNPYTETGETFKIPDMLANRADIYNLGDILGGKVDTFKLSYIENSLTSNSILAPLATRGMEDVYKFIKIAQGESIPLDEFDHNYLSSEANEIVGVMKHMIKIQDVVFSVNKEYIKSAATSDNYRVEPIFKLQGSYRNMNKMTEKLVSVMNDNEIQNLIVDHYTGESQTLTSGAESNMLKLKSLMSILTEDEKDRWDMICNEFNRNRQMGGEDSDPTKQIANQLSFMTELFKNKLKQDELDKVDKFKVVKDNEISKVDPNANLDNLEKLIKLIKENQSEEKLIDLFSDRIEYLNNLFVNTIGKRDEEQLRIFKPMIEYFTLILEKNKNKK